MNPAALVAIGLLPVPATEDRIQEFLQGQEGKLVVFIDSRAALARLHALYPYAAVLSPIDTEAMRKQALGRFWSDPGCRLLLADLRVGATGLDLSNASEAIFDLAYEHHQALLLQARGRVHRVHADPSMDEGPQT
jgi:hypothetical protein